MKLDSRANPSARDIAEWHQHIGEAVEHLRKMAFATDAAGKCPLTIASQRELVRHIDRLQLKVYELEGPFEHKVGGPAPYASTSDPSRWVRWLDERESAFGSLLTPPAEGDSNREGSVLSNRSLFLDSPSLWEGG